MITIFILIAVVVAVFFFCKWVDSISYHDPVDGTIYKYDTEDSEFSANQLEKKK